MSVRWLFIIGGIVAGMLLGGCGGNPSSGGGEDVPVGAVTETPDLVATEVAVKKAAAATLTAEALAAQLATEDVEEPAESAPTETPLPAPSPTTAQTAGDSLEVPPTDTPVPPGCAVVSSGLNLRNGPAVVFDPPLRTLLQNTSIIPLARIADNTWIEVQVVDTGEIGWVSAGAEFISCNIDITGLPLGVSPPTPTPLPTATFTPTPIPPTPTNVPAPPKRARVPVDGGQSSLRGQIAIPGFSKDDLKGPNSDVTFRDRLVFQVEVYDPDANKGDYDGAGIKEVNIKIFGPESSEPDNPDHERTERTAGYCVFGGGEPNCNVFDLKNNDRWPETGHKIVSGPHAVRILITTDSGLEELWNWNFEIEK